MNGRHHLTARDLSCIGVLVLFAATLFMTSPTDGDFWWFDSSRHAMNGVFLRDFLFEGGLRHPLDFARAYYQQYPGINIGFYPPFFYLSSVPFIILFGASHAVSQFVVSFYALIAGTFIYLMCLRTMDRLAALATAVCILALPEIMLWSRQVQPDMPALALILATAYGLMRHLERGGKRSLFVTAICLGLCVLTRVQTVYTVPVVLFFLFFYRYQNRPALRLRLLAMVLAALIALPAIAMALYFSQLNQSLAVEMPGRPTLLSLQNWIWYIKVLPHSLSWPGVAIVVVGLIAGVAFFRKNTLPLSLLIVLAFLICSWGFFTVVSNKEPRFNLPSLPFLLMFAASGFFLLAPRVARAALGLLALWLVFQGVVIEKVPVVSGFKEAALQAQVITPKDKNVLISAHRDGSFIFDMRALGNRRDIGVRRADKLFVEMTIMRELGIKDRNMNQQEIVSLLDQQNVTTVVSQTGYLDDQSTMQNFQKVLDAGEKFEKIGVIRMQGTTLPDESQLVLYKRR